jgi:hypothetical protein
MAAQDLEPIFQLAANQQGVDPNMLKAIAQQESSMNPQAVNPTSGAKGLMQFTDATAKAYGINPLDPAQAIPAAAQMFRENLDRSGGDVSQAVASHFAGPNPALHGPKTAAYVQQVADKFNALSAPQPASQPAQGPSVDDWLGKAPAQASAPQPAQGPNVDDWLGKAPAQASAPQPAHEAPFFDETNNPNYKPDPNALKVSVSGTSTSAPQTAPPAGPSVADNIVHQLGLTTRAGISGLVLGIPNMIGDAANSAINLGVSGVNSLTGSNIPQLQLPSQATQELLDKAGVSQPQNGLERGVLATTTAMGGAGGSIGLGKALAQLASPTAKAVGAGLSSLPGMQVIGAGGAGAGGAIAKENGAGLGGQLAAALLGGTLGAIAPSAVTAAIRTPGAVVNNVAGAAAPFVNPAKATGQQFAQGLGPDAAANIAAAIRSAPSYVEGSVPTTAQAGQHPFLVATEKAAQNADPETKIAFAQRTAEQNAARWKQLNGVALTPEELAAAQHSRAELTQPVYAAAHQNTANVGPAFMKYAQIPEVQEAMRRANSAAALDAAAGRGVPPVWPTPDSKAINGSALDYTQRALGDMISEAGRAGSNSRAASLSALKDNIQGWTERYIPGVGQAASDYRALSGPINTMEAGQQIAETIGTRAMNAGANGGDALPHITLGPYKSALVKALKDQPYGIDPAGLNALHGIRQDLQRASVSQGLSTAGSDTAYNISAIGWLAKQLYGENYGGTSGLGKGMGALAATLAGHPVAGLGILSGAANKIGPAAAQKLNAQLADMLLNPQKFLPYLDAQAASSPKAAALSQALKVRQGAVGGIVGSGAHP